VLPRDQWGQGRTGHQPDRLALLASVSETDTDSTAADVAPGNAKADERHRAGRSSSLAAGIVNAALVLVLTEGAQGMSPVFGPAGTPAGVLATKPADRLLELRNDLVWARGRAVGVIGERGESTFLPPGGRPVMRARQQQPLTCR
jgi:hypothetical protein